MKALATLAWGLVLVVLDLRIDGFDVLPDPLGWFIALVALSSAASRHRAYAVAALACLVGLVSSLPGVFVEPGGLLPVLEAAVETVVVFATCTGVAATVPARARTARAIRAWDLGLTLGLVPLILAARQDAGWGPLVLLVGLAELVVFVWFLVLLLGASKEPLPVAHPSPA